MKSIVIQSIVLIFLLGIFSSCDKNYVEPKPVIPGPAGSTGATGTTEVWNISFNNWILPNIFNNASKNCAQSSCHGGTFKPNLTAANAYNSLFETALTGKPVDTVANAGAPENNLLYQKVKSGGSMNDKLPQASYADSILLWLQQGAKNN